MTMQLVADVQETPRRVGFNSRGGVGTVSADHALPFHTATAGVKAKPPAVMQARGSVTGNDYATIAYNIRTGARVWVKRYNSRPGGGDSAAALAARGGRVFVTGGSAGINSGDDYATIAYHG
jgi:hypothetical protein